MDESSNNVVSSINIENGQTDDKCSGNPKPVSRVRSPYLLFGIIAGFMPRLSHIGGIELGLLVVLLVMAIGQSQRYYAVLSVRRRRGFFIVLSFAVVTSIALVYLGALF